MPRSIAFRVLICDSQNQENESMLKVGGKGQHYTVSCGCDIAIKRFESK